MIIGVIITPEREKVSIKKAFEDLNIDYKFINLLEDEWEQNFTSNFDGYLIYPPSFPNLWREIFLKRLFLIKEQLNEKSLPSIESILIYESKISMHDFYKKNNLPHISSHTFFNYQKAIQFAKEANLPIVVKEDAGSGALGVKIIRKRSELIRIIRKSFFWSSTIRKNNLKSIKKNIKSKLFPFKIFVNTDKSYLPIETKRQGYIHFQEYSKIKYEWRVIRIGESFFGHKKLEDKNGYHSGSLNKGWGPIDSKLLDLIEESTQKLSLNSICIDVFEDVLGNYYINEMQVMFGTSTEHQLIIDDAPGRYILKDNMWLFEQGSYTKNRCNNLRIQTLIDTLDETK